jgi:hypothetical protein
MPIKTLRRNSHPVIVDGKSFRKMKSDLAKWIGQPGPIIVNTEVAHHNIFLEDDLTQDAIQVLLDEDSIKFGTNEANLTKEDFKAMMKKLKRHLSRLEFENGRSYFYEGLEFVDGAIEIQWGS